MTNVIHVYPLDDLVPHDTEGETCHCCPRVEEVGAGKVVIHNSYDRRELLEFIGKKTEGILQ